MSNRIKEVREQHGIRQKDLAQQIGTSPAALSLIERRDTSPRIITLRRIATALKVSIDELISI